MKLEREKEEQRQWELDQQRLQHQQWEQNNEVASNYPEGQISWNNFGKSPRHPSSQQQDYDILISNYPNAVTITMQREPGGQGQRVIGPKPKSPAQSVTHLDTCGKFIQIFTISFISIFCAVISSCNILNFSF
ncbi:uncharacterized protein LOC142336941 isoform X2 [Convolutriloba macropyga]